VKKQLGNFSPLGEKKLGKNWKYFTKTLLEYLEKSTNLENHKTGGKKNTAPKP
jgi:hypothetical protein